MEKLAERIAIYIKEHTDNHPASVAVLKFGIQGFLSVFITTVVLLVVSVMLGQVYEVFILAISFGVLRMMIGGAHVKTGWGCTLSSTVMLVGLSYILISPQTSYALLVCSLLIVIKFPFYLEPHQSRKSLQYAHIFKVGTFIWIGFGFLSTYLEMSFSSAFSIGIFAQAFTITPIGVKAIHQLNRWL
ncbi:accessory gene regulator ArgB-like protein [Aneurinibacillus sp. REN35]|uniref:accessory gene regulator ArgB-like protein n=1 Tax=Aneurinibacillus sp. REN35 TaxID=3237286 RepID=UPI00352723FF